MGSRIKLVDVLVSDDSSAAFWNFLDLLIKVNPGMRIRVDGDKKRWNINLSDADGLLLATGSATSRRDALKEIIISINEAARFWRSSPDEQLRKIVVPSKGGA